MFRDEKVAESFMRTIDGLIGNWFFWKLCFVSGMSLGFIAMPFYAIPYLIKGELLNFLIAFALIPIANGITVFVYGVIGYPVYKYLAKKNLLRLGTVEVTDADK